MYFLRIIRFVLEASGDRGRRGQVAQLVEQRTENPRVGGSIPSLGTIASDTRRITLSDFVKMLSHGRSDGHSFSFHSSSSFCSGLVALVARIHYWVFGAQIISPVLKTNLKRK